MSQRLFLTLVVAALGAVVPCLGPTTMTIAPTAQACPQRLS